MKKPGRLPSSVVAWTDTAPFTPPFKPVAATSTSSDNEPSLALTTPPKKTWLQLFRVATATLVCVLRNAGFSILVGWFFGYCYTVGNVASGQPPAEQSYASFVAANGAWFHGVFSATVVVMVAIRLTPEKFVVHSSRNAQRPTEPAASRTLSLFQCSLKVLYHMIPHLAFSTTAEVVGCYLLIKNLPPSQRKYKPAMYMHVFWGNFSLAGAEYCTRHIFNSETVRGLARRQAKWELKHTNLPVDATAKRDGPPRYRHSLRRFLAMYLRTLPIIMTACIAIVYVHLISLFASIKRESELMAFAIGSIALKLTLQEVATRHLLSTTEPLPRRDMIFIVSTPTVLVDTQVRMLLMQLQDVNISVLGSAVLALTEISVRAVKSMLVHQGMKNLLRKRIVPACFKAQSRVTVTQAPAETLRTMKPARPISDESESRRQRHLVVHAAEIYADMYAEYMAMGCSYAIMFFFWNHPQYKFIASSSEEAEATQRLNQFTIFAFQVSVEIVVDFLACNVEAMQGVDFGSFNQNDPFLTFFMSMLAFANVSISAGLYIHS